jgi:DNA repair exonuclease SbcCD ATPase subunit
MVIVLELENICGFVGRHKFEFREGLNEVVAPNASGKTSLIKALLAMYVPDAVPVEDLLNLDASEGLIKLEIDGSMFIRRFRRERGKVVEVEVESRPVTKDPRLRYIVLDPQLGEIVRRIVLEMRADLTDYLTDVFKLDELRKRRDNLYNEIEKLKAEIDYRRKQVAELRVYEEEGRRLEEERRKRLEELERLKAVSIERVQEIQTRISLLSRRLGEVESRLRDLRERLIPAAQDKQKALQLEIDRLRRVVSEFYEKYPEPDAYLENLKNLMKEVDDQIVNWQRGLADYKARQNAKLLIIEDAVRSKANVCPVCGRPVENPGVFWSSRYEAEAKSLESIIRDYEARIERAEEERARLWRELEKVVKEYNEVKEIKSIKLPKYELEYSNLVKVLESYEKEVKVLGDEKERIIKEIESLKQRLSKEEQEVAERRARLEEEIGRIEQQIKDLEEQIAKLSEAGKELAEAERRLKQLQEELSKVERELYSTLTELKEEFARIANEVVRELGFGWIKAVRLVSDAEGRRFEVKIVRALPSGREAEQPLSTLSTSERSAVALIAVLTGYRLRLLDEYRNLIPIIADEALLAFDPQRYEKVLNELRNRAKYVIVTRLEEPSKAPTLRVVHE